jgi:hypothetical protein
VCNFNSATPLLDIQVHLSCHITEPCGFYGIQQLTIVDYRPDDTIAPTYLRAILRCSTCNYYTYLYVIHSEML